MKVYDYKVIVEPDEEAGGYVVSCPALEGCYSQGETIEEALDNIREAILLCLEDLQEQAMPLPDASKMLIGSVAVAV
ncbi:MAG: type II toxin-antitoxin system HicB family antitoxin [Chloroflexi bacterium]|nr:type II toxin-antitoxin system HicB family antitoxin [Chloroflexota bacterium]